MKMREALKMLAARLRGTSFGASDPVKKDVDRRQWALALRLSKITGEPPERLMDYRRADGILERR